MFRFIVFIVCIFDIAAALDCLQCPYALVTFIPPPKIILCTFGSVPEYGDSLGQILMEAEASGYFTDIIPFTQHTLPLAFNEAWANSGKPGIPRLGYGFWLWKPMVIKEVMTMFPEPHNIIIYADAGCTIKYQHPANREWFNAWIRGVMSHPTHRISFQLPHIEEMWTKGDLFVYMRAQADAFTKTPQHEAAIGIYLNTPENKAFVNAWLDICLAQSCRFISNDQSQVKNAPSFIDHRND